MADIKVMEISYAVRKQVLLLAEKEHFPSNLRGLCARASAMLAHVLIEKGYSPKFILGTVYPHVVIELDGEVIDLTATQFNHTRARVYIRPWDEAKASDFYYSAKKFSTVAELITYQGYLGWSQREIPKPEDLLYVNSLA